MVSYQNMESNAEKYTTVQKSGIVMIFKYFFQEVSYPQQGYLFDQKIQWNSNNHGRFNSTKLQKPTVQYHISTLQ